MFSNEQVPLADLPTVETIQLKSIDNKYYCVLIFNITISYIPFFILFLLLNVYTDYTIFNNSYIIFWFTALVLAYILSFVAYTLGFKKRKYALRENDIIYTSGYLNYKLTVLPLKRIQHIDLEQPFLTRFFKLGNIILYSAGDSGGDLAIKGLPINLAKQLNTYLTNVVNERF